MNNKKTQNLVFAGLIAALYVALTYAQEGIFPKSTSMAVQYRLSEALCIFALFTPAAVPGLGIGCFLANTVSISALPMDMVFGPIASVLSAFFMYKCRNIKIRSLPILSFFMPAIFNGVIIGLEIEMFFIEGNFHFLSFLTQGALVALGEIAVLFTAGLLLYKLTQKYGAKGFFAQYK